MSIENYPFIQNEMTYNLGLDGEWGPLHFTVFQIALALVVLLVIILVIISNQ